MRQFHCSSVLHCIALHCIALHCIALYCIALHCIVWSLPLPLHNTVQCSPSINVLSSIIGALAVTTNFFKPSQLTNINWTDWINTFSRIHFYLEWDFTFSHVFWNSVDTCHP